MYLFFSHQKKNQESQMQIIINNNVTKTNNKKFFNNIYQQFEDGSDSLKKCHKILFFSLGSLTCTAGKFYLRSRLLVFCAAQKTNNLAIVNHHFKLTICSICKQSCQISFLLNLDFVKELCQLVHYLLCLLVQSYIYLGVQGIQKLKVKTMVLRFQDIKIKPLIGQGQICLF